MQTTQTTVPWWYPLALRLRIWATNTAGFFRDLAGHPIALVGGLVVLLYVAAAILAPQIAPHDPTKGELLHRLEPPVWAGGSMDYWLGTDAQGRDLWSRIVFGSRISLWVGFVSVAISAIVGVLLGCLAGYFRGALDEVLSRFSDLLLAFPYLIFAIAVMAFMGPGMTNLLLALTFKGWVEFYRLARGEMLSEKTKEYVAAATAVGMGHLRIIVSEVLPNIFHSVLVLATLRLGVMIVTEASLSFLGLGIQPPTPAWGSMVSEGRDYLTTSWWVSTLPGLAILILVLAINVFGEGLRDILDPRLKIE
ncbi:MAG: ABC transporter permease [Anaerolineae bacterium]|nr:ABC transporter permease [Anaerolineae bacterium]